MSLPRLPLGSQGADQPNFFWLSQLGPTDLFFSFLKPNSSKSSLSSTIFDKQTPKSSRPTSSRTMSLKDETAANSGNSSAAPTISSPTPDLGTPETEVLEKTAEQWKPGKKEWAVMITFVISNLVVALESSILVTVLPTLASRLNGTTSEAFWAGTSYLLVSAVVQLFIAALSDIFGRRGLLVPSILAFTAGSIVCALAHNFTVLLVGRVIQGVGGGGIICLGQLVFADIVPLRQRPRYFSLVLAAWAIGTIFGPLIGGSIVEHTTWRWCFWLNLPVCGIALPMAFFCVRLHNERKSLLEKIRMVDWFGGLLFTASITSFLVAITGGGVDNPWASWRTTTPLIVGAMGLIIAMIYGLYIAKHPFIQRQLFPNTSALATYVCALFQGFLLYIALYYLAFYFSAAKLSGPFSTGIKLLPVVVLTVPSNIVCSALITRFGTYRWAIWLGYGITTIACGLMITFDEHTRTAVWASVLCVLGLGLGMSLSSVSFATQASVVDTRDSGRAAAMYAFMRTLGMTLGVALGSTIFQNLMKRKLRELGLDEKIASQAEGFVTKVLTKLPPNDPLVVNTLKAYAYGFKGVFITMAGIAGGALIISALVQHHSMDKLLDSRFKLEKAKQGRDEPEA